MTVRAGVRSARIAGPRTSTGRRLRLGLVVALAVTAPAAAPAATQSGALIAFERSGDVYLVRPDATGLRRVTHTGWAFDPEWSPDHRWIAFSGRGGIDVIRPDGTGTRHVLVGDAEPAWSPDGRRIVAVHYRGYHARLKGLDLMRADGSNARTLVRLVGQGQDDYDPDPVWSPDGATIAFAAENAAGSLGIAVVAVDGRGRHRITNRRFATSTSDTDPSWSPDGRHIAFARTGPNGTDIAVVNANGTGVRLLTDDGSSSDPAWSPDGTQLAFVQSGPGNTGSYGIAVMNADGSGPTRVTDGIHPAWR